MDRDKALKYDRKRKNRKRATIVSGICSLGIAIFVIIAFSLMSVDRFTITTNNEEELCLTLDENYEKQTTKLVAPPLLKATDTQYSDIPKNIDEGLGSKNEDHYFAYSFYLGGISKGKSSINYNLAMSLNRYSNSLEEAIRVMIIRNSDNPMIYSKPSENGGGKPIYTGTTHEEVSKVDTGKTTTPFRNNKYIIVEAYNIKPGEFDKYTIVIWIDGWESVNEMKGGIFSADIKFSTNSIN